MIIDYNNKQTEYYNQSRPELLARVPKGLKKVLDIGCGSGFFLKDLKEKERIETWGIEPDYNSSVIAKKHVDVVIHSGFNEGIDELNGQVFDAIFFNDVLEHLILPIDALVLSKKYLQKNGVVIASIPNILYFNVMYSILKNRDWKYENEGTLDNTHMRFFTRKSMIRMFHDAGFEIESIEGINPTSHKKFNLLNSLMFNKLNDFKFLQYHIVARPIS